MLPIQEGIEGVVFQRQSSKEAVFECDSIFEEQVQVECENCGRTRINSYQIR
jgi:hypothetical protein